MAEILPRRRPLLALLITGVLVLGLVGFRLRHRGLSLGLPHQLAYSSWAESRNLWAYLGYHLETLQLLRWDEAAGVYNFRHTLDRGLAPLGAGKLAFHRGDFPGAIAHLERAVDESHGGEESLFWLALGLMRQAEAANCLAALTDEHSAHGLGGGHGGLCTLPISRFHEHKELSRRAMAMWTRLLDRHDLNPSDRRLYRWLLNFSAMTVGDWPGGVAARDRVETDFTDSFYGERAAASRSRHADLRFVDRAAELGVENLGNGRGNAVEDFDSDGDLDLIATGYFGGVSFFANQGGLRFVDRTAEAGLAGLHQPLSISPGDYDGDGDLDLFITLPFTRFHLLEAVGPGTYRDVTAASGLWDSVPQEALAVSWMASWGDFDRDGDLDLAVASWNLRFPFVSQLAAKPRIDTKVFENHGGSFDDVTERLGLSSVVADQHFIGATWGDFDRDGWLDLFFSSPLPQTSVLLHNQPGKGTGRRLVPHPGFSDPAPGFTAAFVDVDHDGRLDLFRGGANDARSAVELAVFGDVSRRFKAGRSTILRQEAGGRFVPHDEWFGGGGLAFSTMGASWGDLDNDGCLDFYLGTGSPEPWNIVPNLMFRGREANGRCTGEMDNVSMLGGFGNVQKGHGIVFFDFDEDGDQDVYSSLGGMWPADRWTSQLFVNEGDHSRAWLKLRLRGRKSNTFGLGSQLTVRARSASGRKLVRTAQIDNKTGFGSPPYLAHIGLDDAVAVEGVEVRWLGTGCIHTYEAALGVLTLLDEADCFEGPP